MIEACTAASCLLSDTRVQQSGRIGLCDMTLLETSHHEVMSLEIAIWQAKGDVELSQCTGAMSTSRAVLRCCSGYLISSQQHSRAHVVVYAKPDRTRFITPAATICGAIGSLPPQQNNGFCVQPAFIEAVLYMAHASSRRSRALQLPSGVAAFTFDSLINMASLEHLMVATVETLNVMSCRHAHQQNLLFNVSSYHLKIKPDITATGTTGCHRDSSNLVHHADWLYFLEWLSYDSSVTEAMCGIQEAIVDSMHLAMPTGGHVSLVANAVALGQQAAANNIRHYLFITRGAVPAVAAGYVPLAGSIEAQGLWAFARTLMQEATNSDVQAVDMQLNLLDGHNTAALLTSSLKLPSKAYQPSASAYGHGVQGNTLVAAALQRLRFSRISSSCELNGDFVKSYAGMRGGICAHVR